AAAPTAAVRTGTATRSPRASTRSSRWTCTCPAARRGRRPCSRASCSCRSASRTRTWRADGEVIPLSSSEPEVTDAPVSEAAPRDEVREALLAELVGLVGDAVVESHIAPGLDLWVRVRPDAWAQVANSLRITMGARYFGFLSAIDW